LEDWEYIMLPMNGVGPPEFTMRYFASFPEAPLGQHTMRMKLKDYNLTWTERPLGMEIPTEFDLGDASFEVVPRGVDSVVPIEDLGVEWVVEKCVSFDLLRRDKGNLDCNVLIQNSPVDLAFRVSIVGGGGEWPVGEVVAPKGGSTDETYSHYEVADATKMLTSGFTLKFTPDADVARRTTQLKGYWNKELLIRGVSIGQDTYLKSRGQGR